MVYYLFLRMVFIGWYLVGILLSSGALRFHTCKVIIFTGICHLYSVCSDLCSAAWTLYKCHWVRVGSSKSYAFFTFGGSDVVRQHLESPSSIGCDDGYFGLKMLIMISYSCPLMLETG